MVARWIPSLCLFSAPHLFIFTPIARPNCEGPDGRSAEVSEPKLRIWRRSLSQSYEMKSPDTEIFTVMKEERKQETSRFNQPELQLWSELCPDWFSLIGESSLGPDVSWTLRLTDLFRAAAEVGPHHILKMYNTSGGVLNISPQLEANSQDSYYRLEVVASDLKSESCRGHFGKKRCVTNLRSWKINPGCVFVHVQVRGCRQSWTTWRAGEWCTGTVQVMFVKRLKDSLLSPVSASRLHHLESKVMEDVGKTPDILCELKSQVESFKKKLEVRVSDPQRFWFWSHEEDVDRSCWSWRLFIYLY